jgi:predicted RNA-binding protein with PUA-like domain
MPGSHTILKHKPLIYRGRASQFCFLARPCIGINGLGRKFSRETIMPEWLFKEEPTHYSFDDLVRDGRTTWHGVTNALALKYLSQVHRGDLIFYYHTGSEKAVVGIMRAVTDAYLPGKETKLYIVDVEPVEKLPRQVSLAEIKAQPQCADWELVRLPRLSVMPVPRAIWNLILKLARKRSQ